ncbi:MAG: hypothetical protein L6Q31_12905 [Fimbriimonadaceae bacterium]|nr:hypothetical protein [Fimbriimonadaceae bacterium]
MPIARDPTAIDCRFKLEFADPAGNRTVEQFTIVEDRTHLYAEKTYLKVSIINPHDNDALVPDIDIDEVILAEVPHPNLVPNVVFNGPGNPGPLNSKDNNWDHGGDVIDRPGSNPELVPTVAFAIRDGVSKGRDSEATFFVRAVARRRVNSAGVLQLDFHALLQVPAVIVRGAPIDTSDILAVAMWVDEEDFFPRNTPPGRHALRTGSTKTIDWIERQAADFLSTGTSPAEISAFDSVERVLSDGYVPQRPAVGAHVGPLDQPCPYPAESDPTPYQEVHVNPFATGLRWGREAEWDGVNSAFFEPTDSGSGVSWAVPREALRYFEQVLSHEARHALQFKLGIGTQGANDIDFDHFPSGLTAGGYSLSGGERLLDSGLLGKGGSNPEFDLYGENADERTILADCLSKKPAFERDAFIAQRSVAPVEFNLSAVDTPVNTEPLQKGGTATLRFPLIGPRPGIPFIGYGGVASVTSGNCTVSDGVLRSGSSVSVRVEDENGLRVDVTAPDHVDSCTIEVRAYVPTNGTGAPVVLTDQLHSAQVNLSVQ